MRLQQYSFSRGEITPLLHARVDLAMYMIGVAYMLNFYPLAQGGAARRPAFVWLGDAAVTIGDVCPIRLVEFIYNRTDAMIVELYDRGFRVWQRSTRQVVAQGSSPYAMSDLEDIKFAQSGNVIFMTHRDYPVQILTRHALGDWEFAEFQYRNGPWLPDRGKTGIRLTVGQNGTGRYYYSITSNANYFDSGMVGSLIELSYTIEKNVITGESLAEPNTYVSPAVEVGGEWNLQTFNSWRGEVEIQKSNDLGETWFTLRSYKRQDPGSEANIDASGAETEPNVLYRIRAQHLLGSGPISFSFTANGFVKSYIFKITEFVNAREVTALWQQRETDAGQPIEGEATSDWRIGAWGGENGYPACAAFYQGRFALAGSTGQPQTIWMSKIDDFADFGVSDPLRDDDAINITLSADDLDGIHSLLAMTDLIAFTGSSEWRIKGAGDNGAISPNAVVAHEQDNIGSAPIQPLLVGGQPVMVQTHRAEVHVLRYMMDMDGYSGSNLSVLSNHLFRWKTARNAPPADRRIRRTVYQQEPDGLVWFLLADGTAVTCTYMAEHEVVAWARQQTDGFIGGAVCVPADGYDELWAVVRRGSVWGIEVLDRRDTEGTFVDAGNRAYESCIKTLRINFSAQGGSLTTAKKLAPRLAAYVVRSDSAWVAPVTDVERKRRRQIRFGYSSEMTSSDIQLDTGFEEGAAVQIWTSDPVPLTILSLCPMVTIGGG